MADAQLFEASEGFDTEIDGDNPNILNIFFKNEEGEVTAIPARFIRDEQGLYSLQLPGISDAENFRIVDGKIQIL